MIVRSRYTRDEDFSGAAAVFDGLSVPGELSVDARLDAESLLRLVGTA